MSVDSAFALMARWSGLPAVPPNPCIRAKAPIRAERVCGKGAVPCCARCCVGSDPDACCGNPGHGGCFCFCGPPSVKELLSVEGAPREQIIARELNRMIGRVISILEADPDESDRRWAEAALSLVNRVAVFEAILIRADNR